jgi:MinD-like ATPase involved in chromosome partitioning or flagellar assembly
VTTNNDTPEVFSDDARGDGAFGREWRDEPGGADLADGGYPADAEAYRSWFAWEAQAPGYPEEPEYPRGPGYAPLPPDHPGLGYPAGPGYAPDVGYGYPHDGWNEPGPEVHAGPPAALDPRYPGYAPEPGYGRDAGAIPPMESLPAQYGTGQYGTGQYGAGQYGAEQYGTDQAAWSGAGTAYQSEPGYPGPAEMSGWVSPGRAAPQASAETSDSLTAESLLHTKRSASGSGWRHRIFRATGGLLRLGESAADMRRRDLINRVRTPVADGHHRVAVLSLKGGVGKTTTAVGLGATFATLRGDRVIAVDANPDRGTLSDKVRLETAATVRDLLNERDQIRRYADVRAFTTQAPSRLEVLASDRDPAVSVAFSADDYCDAAQVLEHFYSISLTDCGTGLLHSAMAGVLALADQIVVVSSPSVDGARSASATLDWLEAHRCGDLVRNGVVVLSTIRPKSKSTVDLDRLEHHFAARCRAVARIPYDPHLEEGAEVDLELLSAETADAYLTLAALVGDGLAWPRRLTSRAGLP